MSRLAALILTLAALACSSSPAAPPSQETGEVVSDSSEEAQTTSVTTPAGPGKFAAASKMVDARGYHAAVKLEDGRVMAIAGKSRGGASAWKPSSIEATAIYDPSTEKWTDSALLSTVREHPTGHLLQDGRIVAIGGSAVRPGRTDARSGIAELLRNNSSDIVLPWNGHLHVWAGPRNGRSYTLRPRKFRTQQAADAWARRHLGDSHRFMVRPCVDCPPGTPGDRRRPRYLAQALSVALGVEVSQAALRDARKRVKDRINEEDALATCAQRNT